MKGKRPRKCSFGYALLPVPFPLVRPPLLHLSVISTLHRWLDKLPAYTIRPLVVVLHPVFALYFRCPEPGLSAVQTYYTALPSVRLGRCGRAPVAACRTPAACVCPCRRMGACGGRSQAPAVYSPPSGLSAPGQGRPDGRPDGD